MGQGGQREHVERGPTRARGGTAQVELATWGLFHAVERGSVGQGARRRWWGLGLREAHCYKKEESLLICSFEFMHIELVTTTLSTPVV